ncbi:MAG: hypothetical protein MUQ72_06870 [Flavobacteriaceae bacterium]|nr:hypothetical protein [Flavobacteriaceae bacterium]MDO7612316.1 hypothetical protein [Flavobacteriaceae bacterium]
MMGIQEGIKGKKPALLAYFTIMGAIIAISIHNNKPEVFSRFHIRQAFGVHILFHAFALFISQWFNEFAFLGLYVMYLLLWGFGFYSALQNTKKSLPFIGIYFQQWFTFIR